MTRPIPGLHQNMMVMTPPVMGTAQMPRSLASTGPSVDGKSTITIDTTKILPCMVGTRFKHTRSAGASTDRAQEEKGFKKGNGSLNIEGASALKGPGVMAKGVPGDRRGQDILNGKMVMPYVEMSGHSKGGRH